MDGEWVQEGRTDERYWNGRGPHGGWTAAQLLRRMRAAAPAMHLPRSMHLEFIDRVNPGVFEVRTQRIRQLSKVTFVRAQLLQNGGVCVEASAAFAPPDAGDVRYFEHAPLAADPAKAGALDALDALAAFPRMFEYRGVNGWPGAPDADAITSGFIRPRGTRRITHEQVAMMADAWFPALWASGVRGPASTVSMALVFGLADQAVEIGAAEFLQASFRTSAKNGKFGDESGSLWLPDGRLAAKAQQLLIYGSANDVASAAHAQGSRAAMHA